MTKHMETINYLAKFQAALKAPKGQFNNFGKYKYRSAEDIVEAVKPIINPDGYYLNLTDDIVLIGERYYVKATATISNGQQSFTASAFAREEMDKKGMDCSQITGAASSYARKYALNGLFAIDDTKDADTNEHNNELKAAKNDLKQLAELLPTDTEDWNKAVMYVASNGEGSVTNLLKKRKISEANQKLLKDHADQLNYEAVQKQLNAEANSQLNKEHK